MSRTQRRRFAPALVALAAFAGIAAGTSAGTFTVAAGDQEQPRWPRRAALTIDPPLSRASAAAEEARAQQLMNTVVFEHAVFERAVAEKAKRESIWDAIAACETQGNWSMRGSSFSGGVGFANTAWSSFGGHEFAPNAGQATREQQIIVAERIRARVGMGAWGCAKRLGLT
ncbi:MAG TPA: transglycosylase family protein [Acidimicrobiia bacterium]|nr:transglycosylase family protein [Acidimicrobiia bacterium]